MNQSGMADDTLYQTLPAPPQDSSNPLLLALRNVCTVRPTYLQSLSLQNVKWKQDIGRGRAVRGWDGNGEG